MRLLIIFFLFGLCYSSEAQHPVAFAANSYFGLNKTDLFKFPVLKNSYDEGKQMAHEYFNRDLDMPHPKDLAAGHTHRGHKLLSMRSVMKDNPSGGLEFIWFDGKEL